MKIRELPVDDLVLDPRMNLRDRLDQDTVERYMEAWDRLPPVTVYEVDGELLLADGIHRHAAAVTLGKPRIKAEVIEGTLEEALDFVSGANLHHGLPLTRSERRRDRHLAEELYVGRELVAKIRKQLIESAQIPVGEIRVGSDGKKYPSLPKDPNERKPISNLAGGAEPESGVRAKGGDAPWDESGGGASQGRDMPRKVTAPWDEETPDAKALANAPPIAPAAPTIDEMLQVMARQVIEVVNWTNAEGFLESYKVASANTRGLFQSAVIKLAARADQLRKV